MKTYYGRRVRIYEHKLSGGKLIGEGRMLDIDIAGEHVMVEDTDGNIIKLHYKLVKFV